VPKQEKKGHVSADICPNEKSPQDICLAGLKAPPAFQISNQFLADFRLIYGLERVLPVVTFLSAKGRANVKFSP
jgi:hypothetical protein